MSRVWRSPFLLLVALLLLAGTGTRAHAQSTSAYVPGEVLIQFREGASAQAVDAVLSQLGAQNVRTFSSIRVRQEHISGMAVADAVARFRSDPAVAFIEPNYIVTLDRTPTDPLFPQLWGMRNTGQTGGTPGADISATTAWDMATGSDSILVAVIDTGMDYTHEDLAPNVWTNPGEIPGNGIDDDGNGYVDDVHGYDFVNHDGDPMDDHGHGTHVSGTIGAVANNGVGVAGVCWHVKIMACKFLSAGGSGSTADAILAVEYATQMHARIMSNSWGGGAYSDALRLAIQAASDAGILFVAAAGNDGANNDLYPHYPANYDVPLVIAVASTDHNDHLSYFSDYGAQTVDLAAPGENILSTFPHNGYVTLSGTSMATPHVSGALALMLGRYPHMSGTDAKRMLLASVDVKPGLTGKVLSNGRLNAFMMVAEPDSTPPGAITDLSVVEANGSWTSLRWTATGDDSTSGRASRYDLRYSTAPITASNFDAATAAPALPDPRSAGEADSARVDSLAFSTTYYFALKAFDEFGNSSPMSNVVSATTLPPPVIAVGADSLTAALFTGGIEAHALSLHNSGPSELAYRISVAAPAAGAQLTQRFSVTRDDGLPGDPGGAGGGARYTGDARPRRGPLGPQDFGFGGPKLASADLRILILNSGGDVSEIRSILAGMPDVAAVDEFDARGGTPTLDLLRQYHGVILSANIVPGNPMALGDVLADYADAGGGVVLTLASFISGWNLQGRFLSGGYYPFTLGSGPIGPSSLGTFDPGHPIMKDVHSAWGDLLGQTTVAPGAQLVASYTSGLPMVATQGRHVVGVNVYVGSSGYWTGDVPLILHNAVRWSGNAIGWLASQPREGRVPAGTTVDVSVIFNATGLNGGDYRAELVVDSNDPLRPTVAVPAHLHVTGAPNLHPSADALAFGSLFVGASRAETLLVTNDGTDLLDVTSVSVNVPAYTVQPSSLQLSPGQSAIVRVVFAPPSPGSYPGTLTFQSNDPDQPSMGLSLTGASTLPPILGVSPDSLTADLFTGAQATRTLHVSNTGVADLAFSIHTRDQVQVQAASASQPVIASGHPVPLEGLGGSGIRTVVTLGTGVGAIDRGTPSRPGPTPAATSAVRIAGTEVFGSMQNQFFAGPRTRGNIFHCTTTSMLQEHRFYLGPSMSTALWFLVYEGMTQAGTYHLISASNISPAPPGEGWFSSGPVDVLMESGRYYLIVASFEQASTYYNELDMAPYPIPASFGELIAGAGWDWAPTSVFPPDTTQSVPDWAFGSAAAYYQTLVTRRGPRWLSAAPTEGVVSPGATMDVTATLDAAFLNGGDYLGDLVIDSNDPIRPEVAVPAHLHVTGAPDIALSDSALAFGTLFVGASRAESLVVRNIGTDRLDVTEVAAEPSAFWAGPPSFSLDPGQSRTVFVRFAPNAAGPFAGTLTIHSNDPDHGTIVLPLTGTGLLPPDIAVTPDSLSADLLTGQKATRTVHVANVGASDLTFEVWTEGEASLAGARLTRPATLVPPPGTTEPRHLPGAQVRTLPTAPAVVDSAGFSFREDFEDGDLAGWIVNPSGSLKEVTSQVAAAGTRYSYHEAHTSPGGTHFEGITHVFQQVRPTNVGFWVRCATNTAADGYFVLSDASGYALIWFMADQTGRFYVNGDIGGDTSVPYQPLTWYHVEFRNLDFAAKTFDYYVDGTLMKAAIPFRNAPMIQGISLLDLYNWSPGSEAWWDQIQMGVGSSSSWLKAEPLAGTVPAGGSLDLTVTFDATGLMGGLYNGRVLVTSNDPDEPVVATAARLSVTGVPDLQIGRPLVMQSVKSFSISGASTTHDFVLPGRPVGDATLELLANGDFGESGENATLSAEGITLGSVGPVGVSCYPADGTFPVSAALLAQLAADGVVHALVQNSAYVDVFCTENSHRVTLRCALPSDSIDFGRVYLGSCGAETLTVKNAGTDALTVTGVSSSDPTFAAAPNVFTLAPGAEQAVRLTFCPTAVGARTAQLTITSNDPDAGSTTVVLLASAGLPPQIAVAPDSLTDSLYTGQRAAKTLRISNPGGSDLRWSIGFAAAGALRTVGLPQTPPPGVSQWPGATELASGQAPAGYAATAPSPRSTVGAQVLIIEDAAPWGTSANEWILDSLGVAWSMIGSSQLASTPLDGYRVVLVPSDQYSSTYANLAAQAGKLANYVAGGGVLEFHAAGFGWNAGNPSVVELPGRMRIRTWFSYNNYILLPQHPLVAGVPNPFTATYASHANFDSIPTLAERVVVDESGTPDLVVYRYGLGRVVSGGQTLEFGYMFRRPGGQILANMIPFSLGAGARWLTMSPLEGVVPPGGAMDVTATFDASEIASGDFRSLVGISSNAPSRPLATVPAHLHVIGVPDIVVADSAIAFGTVLIGDTATYPLKISNAGPEVLVVSAIHSDVEVVTLSPASFSVAPGATQEVTVRFIPTVTTPIAGQLTILSNDPDEGTVTVSLGGAGLVPPEIAVLPESLWLASPPGGSTAEALRIRNSGGSALTVDLSMATGVPGGAAPAFAAVRPEGGGGAAAVRGGAPGARMRALAGAAAPAAMSLAGSRVLLIEDVPPWGTTANEQVLTGAGMAYDIMGSAQLDGVDLTQFPLVIVAGDQLTSTYTNLAAHASQLEAYVSAGGTLEFHAAGWGSHAGNASLVTLPGGVRIYSFTSTTNHVQMPSHPLMAGIPEPFHGNPASLAYLQNVPGQADLIATDAAAHPNLVVYDYGAGRVIAGGQAFERGFVVGESSGQILRHMIPFAGANLPSWRITPASAVVAAGESLDVTVSCSAPRLGTGTFANVLSVRSNDPDEKLVAVPVQLDVTTLPIVSTPATLEFAPVMVGRTRTLSLPVRNRGASALHVSAVTSSRPDYTADRGSFEVASGDSVLLQITFAPADSGARPAELSLASDAIHAPQVVKLTGVGVPPPDVAVAADSLHGSAAPGRSTQVVLRVLNTGAGSLAFQASAAPAAPAAAAFARAGAVPGRSAALAGRPGALQATESSWLSVAPASGSVAPGSSLDVSVGMDAADLGLGDYHGHVTLTTNDPDEPTVTVEAFFHVRDTLAAKLIVIPAPLNLGSQGKYVRVSIELPSGFDPRIIRVPTVRFCGVLADSTTAKYIDMDLDSLLELNVGFDRIAVAAALPYDNPALVTVSGEAGDHVYVAGGALLGVIRHRIRTPNGGERIAAGSRFNVQWSVPSDWKPDHAELFWSADAGLTWTSVARNIRDSSYTWRVPQSSTTTGRVRVDLFDSIGLLASDESDSLFQVTAGSAAADAAPPLLFTLGANRPNPFAGATRIRFDLPVEREVRLEIFDASGRLARELVRDRVAAGRHEIEWDGTDGSGHPAAPGVYIVRIQAGEFHATRRIVRVR